MQPTAIPFPPSNDGLPPSYFFLISLLEPVLYHKQITIPFLKDLKIKHYVNHADSIQVARLEPLLEGGREGAFRHMLI